MYLPLSIISNCLIGALNLKNKYSSPDISSKDHQKKHQSFPHDQIFHFKPRAMSHFTLAEAILHVLKRIDAFGQIKSPHANSTHPETELFFFLVNGPSKRLNFAARAPASRLNLGDHLSGTSRFSCDINVWRLFSRHALMM